MATDKQTAELAAAVAHVATAESAHEAESVEPAADAGAEEISMEDVLGSGTKKAPVAEKESVDEVPQVESRRSERNWFRDFGPARVLTPRVDFYQDSFAEVSRSPPVRTSAAGYGRRESYEMGTTAVNISQRK